MSEEKLTSEQAHQSQGQIAFRRALQSMYGHSEFALLGDVYRAATEEFGFTGTMDDALRVLSSLPDVTVQPAVPLAHSRIAGGGEPFRPL